MPASSAQISQLVLQVDANVAVAQRSLQDLARVVNTSTGQMNASLGSTAVAHGRMTAAFNQSRLAQMELQHVVTASVDAYAAGASPLRILTLEMGRVAEAASFMGGAGALGGIARFMQGPWGIAVLLGVSVLGQLIGKIGDTSNSVADLVEKMRKQAAMAQAQKEADLAWSTSLDGVTEALRKNEEALGKLEEGEQNAATKALAAAIAAEMRLKLIRAETVANIELAKSMLEVQKARASGAGQQGDVAALGIGGRLADLTTFQNNLSKIDVQIGIAEEQIRRATLDVYADVAQKDQSDLIKAKYDRLIRQAEARARAEHKTGEELRQQIFLLKQQEAAELKALETTKQRGQYGKEISFDQAAAIAKGAGLTVTSAYRSVADQARLYNDPRYNRPGNPVAKPGMSAHNGVNGKWALDIAFAPGLTPASLKKLYGDQGVTLSAVYKEAGHYHIEGSRSRAASAENAAARAQQKAVMGDDTFSRESAQLDAELLQIKRQLAGDFNAQAAFATQELDAQKEATLDSIQKQVDGKQITAAQGQILRNKVEEVTAEKKAAIEQDRYVKALEATQAALDQQYGFQLDDLHFADDMAKTQTERRQIELQILDIQYEQRKVDLQILLKKQQQLGDLTNAAITQQQLDQLPAEKAQDRQRVLKGTMNPLQAWADQVPRTAAQINEALQSIEVQGIENLASGIADVINGTKTLGEVFKDISHEIIGQIIQMIIKMLVFRALSAAFGGIFGGGSGSIGADLNFGTSFAGEAVPKLAGGGMGVLGGGGGLDSNLLSLNGQPIAWVSKGEGLAVIPQASRIGTPTAANGNSQAEVHLRISTDQNFHAEVAQVAGATVLAVRPTIIRDAHKEVVRSITRPAISGRG